MNLDTHNLKSPLLVTLSWSESPSSMSFLDLSAFMIEDGQIRELDDFIFYGSKPDEDGRKVVAKNGCIVLKDHNTCNSCTQQCMSIDLEKVDKRIKQIILVVSSDSEHQLSKYSEAQIVLTDSDVQQKEYKMSLDENGDEHIRCMLIGNVYRYGDSWRYEEDGSTLNGGLDIAYNHFVPKQIREKIPFNDNFEKANIYKRKNELFDNYWQQLVTAIQDAYDKHEWEDVVKKCDFALKTKDDANLRHYLEEAKRKILFAKVQTDFENAYASKDWKEVIRLSKEHGFLNLEASNRKKIDFARAQHRKTGKDKPKKPHRSPFQEKQASSNKSMNVEETTLQDNNVEINISSSKSKFPRLKHRKKKEIDNIENNQSSLNDAGQQKHKTKKKFPKVSHQKKK